MLVDILLFLLLYIDTLDLTEFTGLLAIRDSIRFYLSRAAVTPAPQTKVKHKERLCP